MPVAPRRLLRMVLALAVVGLVAPALPTMSSATAASSAASRVPTLVGEWPRITPTALEKWGADRIVPPYFYDQANARASHFQSHIRVAGTLVPNLGARQLWQLYPIDSVAHPDTFVSTRTGVVVFDVDSGQALATFELPMLRRATRSAESGDWLHASDGGARVFFMDGSYVVHIVDARSFSVRTIGLPEPFTIGGVRVELAHLTGLTFDAGTAPGEEDDSLIAYYGMGLSATAISRIPLDGSPPQNRLIRACTGSSVVNNSTLGRNLGVPVLATRDRFLVPCHRNGNAVLVVVLDRASAFQPQGLGLELEIAGPMSMEVAMADPVAERLFLVTVSGEMWVFDGRTNAFVGVVATAALQRQGRSPVSGYGIDEVTGRVYFQSSDFGFGVVEGRFFPVPQAIRVPGTSREGKERIISDAVTRRVYVLEGAIAAGTPEALSYKVYDSGEAPAAPARPDPDRNTADVDESPGRTEGRFFASGSGFGVRALAVKGVSTVPPMVGVGEQTTGQVINKYLNSKCGYTDRELVAGQVAEAEYDTGSTAALAYAVDVDERTEVDLGRASRCDVVIRDGSNERFSGIFATRPEAAAFDGGPGWGHQGASCTSSAGAAATGQGSDDEGRPSFGPSEVVCPEPGGVLTASGTAHLTGPLTVGRAHTDVRIERTAKGVESVVTSHAGGISIGDGLVRIGSIDAEARSMANGRPKREPMSSHTVRMAHVSVNGEELCGATCDPAFVVERLRGFGLGRVEFKTVNGRDEDLLRGTPKGAQTAVQKSPARRASDGGLLGDTRSEVPAFEIIVYNDNQEYGRARQVYQFAGVASAANYNVVPLPSLTSLVDGDDGPTRPDGLSIDTPVGDGSGGGIDALLPAGAVADRPSSGGGGLVGAIRRAVRAVGEGLALIVTDPRRAFLVLTAWAVIVAPAALSRRRRLLLGARS